MVAGVITGHVARSNIRRSGGTLGGARYALTGLILSYSWLALSAATFAFFLTISIQEANKQQVKPDPITAESQEAGGKTPQQRFQAAELDIISDSEGVAYGNSADAIELARKFGEMMAEIREEMFTEDDGGISLSGGNFITYCELSESSCLFLVHVPNYRKYSADAKQSLAKLTWTAARSSATGSLTEEDDLAVGMKGVILFGSVMVGKLGDTNPKIQDKKKDHLLKFFREEADPRDIRIPVEPIEQDTDTADEKPDGNDQ